MREFVSETVCLKVLALPLLTWNGNVHLSVATGRLGSSPYMAVVSKAVAGLPVLGYRFVPHLGPQLLGSGRRVGLHTVSSDVEQSLEGRLNAYQFPTSTTASLLQGVAEVLRSVVVGLAQSPGLRLSGTPRDSARADVHRWAANASFRRAGQSIWSEKFKIKRAVRIDRLCRRVQIHHGGWRVRLVRVLPGVAAPVGGSAIVHRVWTALGNRDPMVDHGSQLLVLAAKGSNGPQFGRNHVPADMTDPSVPLEHLPSYHQFRRHSPLLGSGPSIAGPDEVPAS